MIASPDDFLPPPPPAIDSEKMQADLAEIKGVERTLPQLLGAWSWHSFERAYPWWYRHISTRLFEQKATTNIPEAAMMYAALAVTYHDTIVACFNAKYTYWMIRPPQLDPEIVNIFPIPNHPSYPAAHSCASMASAMVISDFFPADAEMIQAAAYDAGNSRDRSASTIPATAMPGGAGERVATAVLAQVHEMMGQ
ncbi:MAG: hypothetical protein R2911_19050 [Caldilineaceae bacterium]